MLILINQKNLPRHPTFNNQSAIFLGEYYKPPLLSWPPWTAVLSYEAIEPKHLYSITASLNTMGVLWWLHKFSHQTWTELSLLWSHYSCNYYSYSKVFICRDLVTSSPGPGSSGAWESHFQGSHLQGPGNLTSRARIFRDLVISPPGRSFVVTDEDSLDPLSSLHTSEQSSVCTQAPCRIFPLAYKGVQQYNPMV